MYQFLECIEDGSLAFTEDTATSEQLCIVAIGYHNLAIIQLKLEASDMACKSILNARKIARLCLSYSNRWLANFQWTYDICVEDVKFQLATRFGGAGSKLNKGEDSSKWGLTEHQFEVISELTSTFYDYTLDDKDITSYLNNKPSDALQNTNNVVLDKTARRKVYTKPRPIYV